MKVEKPKLKSSFIGPDQLTLKIKDVIEDSLLSHVIMVFGQFGTGKTAAIENSIKELRNYKYQAHVISLFQAENLHDAYLKLIPKSVRLFFVFLGFSSYFFVKHLVDVLLTSELFNKTHIYSSDVLTIFGIAIFALLFPNKIRTLYVVFSTVANYFQNFLGGRARRKIIVLEDLERSGLSTDQQWNLLRTLNGNKCRRYVCTFGYRTRDDRIIALENALKLNAVILSVEPNRKMNLEIILQMFDWVPFKQPEEWLEFFTPRELIDMMASVERDAKLKDVLLEVMAVERVISELKIRLTNKDYNDNSFVYINNSGPEIGLKDVLDAHPRIKSIFASVFNSLREEIRHSLKNTDSGSINEAFILKNVEQQRNLSSVWQRALGKDFASVSMKNFLQPNFNNIESRTVNKVNRAIWLKRFFKKS